MSYGLYLVRVPPGGDVVAVGEALFGSTEDPNAGPMVPETERRKAELAAAVTALMPEVVHQPFDFAEIAEEDGMTEEEAHAAMRHLVLATGPDVYDETRFSLVLFDDSIHVSIPFWKQDEEGRRRFDEVWDLLRMLEEKSGFATYDPHTERAVDLSSQRDWQVVLREYGRMVESDLRYQKAMDGTRPWWKFW